MGVIMELQVVFARPSRSQPIKIELRCEDLMEAFLDGGESIKYLSKSLARNSLQSWNPGLLGKD